MRYSLFHNSDTIGFYAHILYSSARHKSTCNLMDRQYINQTLMMQQVRDDKTYTFNDPNATMRKI